MIVMFFLILFLIYIYIKNLKNKKKKQMFWLKIDTLIKTRNNLIPKLIVHIEISPVWVPLTLDGGLRLNLIGEKKQTNVSKNYLH